MTQKRIVMIAGQSLLVQGMASRLPNKAEGFDLQVLNPEDEDWKGQLIQAKPNVVVMDALDPHIRDICPLTDIIWDLPGVTIMLLNSEFSEIQVINSNRIPISDSQALLDQILTPISPE
jgi:hypothetical protein